MKEQNNSLLHKLIMLYLTWFGAGRAPRAPGTVGTLAALPFIYAWSRLGTAPWINFFFILVLTVLACWAAQLVQKKWQLQDPQWIVVDEVLGMALTWAIAQPLSWPEWTLCFAAFRFFDIVKIWPASFFDQRVKNGAGTILDDMVSAVYAGIFVYAVSVFFLREWSRTLSF